MKSIGIVLLACLIIAAICSGSSAQIVTVTFGTDNIDRLITTGVHAESGVNYIATVGSGWEIVNLNDFRGNPPSALVTFLNGQGAFTGDAVEFTLINNGLFRLLSVDTRANSDANSSNLVEFMGLRNGNFVGSITPVSTIPYTTSTGFPGLIDTLKATVIRNGQNSFWIDNLTLELVPVPEPSSGCLALASLMMFVLRRSGLAAL